jgi:hypothetical protein
MSSLMLCILLSRHLRFLVKSADELIKRPPSLTSLQNDASTTKAVVRAIQDELTSAKQQQNLVQAQQAEEKDGQLNEKYIYILIF